MKRLVLAASIAAAASAVAVACSSSELQVAVDGGPSDAGHLADGTARDGTLIDSAGGDAPLDGASDAGADAAGDGEVDAPPDAPPIVYCEAGLACDWPQWAHDPQHTGSTLAAGQQPNRLLAQLVFDPFVSKEQGESGGDLLAHFPTPLLVGDDVYMLVKTGTYTACLPPGSGHVPDGGPCGPATWGSQVWTEKRLHWEGGQLVEKWTFTSDWKPEPAASAGDWEPVFQAAVSGGYLYVPGAGGALWKIDRLTGATASHIQPFGATLDPSTYVAGALTIDAAGDVLYDALHLDPTNPAADASGWLVLVTPTDATKTATYASLVPDAPAPSASCDWFFSAAGAPLPYPPPPDDAGNPARPPQVPCLSQRPGLNVGPAVAADGTIYTVSAAQGDYLYSYLVAVNPDLSPKWDVSMRDLVDDGCGVAVPSMASELPDGAVAGYGCRVGAPLGVDPETGDKPAPGVVRESSSTPVALPDGTVIYGAFSDYNLARGKLMHFGGDGKFLGSYDFGWDVTPAVQLYDGGAFSIVTKDNHYFNWQGPEGPYGMTWVDPTSMAAQWSFLNTNTESCRRDADGGVSCTSDHPQGFEWCVNAPAVDGRGFVYANSEDGNLYVIDPRARTATNVFLELALGAAYTPIGLDYQGRIYALNGGTMRVLGQ